MHTEGCNHCQGFHVPIFFLKQFLVTLQYSITKWKKQCLCSLDPQNGNSVQADTWKDWKVQIYQLSLAFFCAPSLHVWTHIGWVDEEEGPPSFLHLYPRSSEDWAEWGDNSVRQVLARQAWCPELISSTQAQKPGMVAHHGGECL